MIYLLDTNIVSETSKPRPNLGVIAWLENVSIRDTALSVVTLGEIERGLLNTPDPTRRQRLEAWYRQDLLPQFAGQVLDVTHPVMTEWARLVQAARSAGQTPGTLDALIAATASAHGLIVVTRNIKDFAPLGVPTLNIWTL
ncbi:type II toxin-antitoxin system VapC family toxin [Deinococcus sp. YIM 134068]|uniref:type II toxin-antitoxin system VapC family toxin n=1 Tax=Deinococcus lichenicola TaxID=3118910 RepID=UPI002F92F2B5